MWTITQLLTSAVLYTVLRISIQCWMKLRRRAQVPLSRHITIQRDRYISSWRALLAFTAHSACYTICTILHFVRKPL